MVQPYQGYLAYFELTLYLFVYLSLLVLVLVCCFVEGHLIVQHFRVMLWQNDVWTTPLLIGCTVNVYISMKSYM